MANTKVTAKVIADGTITATQIANDAVTGAKIADDVALAGSPTTTTQSASDNSTKIATTAYVETAVTNLVDSAPSALNTLNELAAALGDDANFSTTVTNSIAGKVALSGSGQTIADSGNLTLDVAGNIILDADGGEFQFKDGGTHFARIFQSGGDFYLNVPTQDTDLIIQGNDGGSNVSALTFDMSDAGRASFNNKASFNNPIAVGQSSFSGGSVLADFHGSGNGVGAQLAFANDHNTDLFYVGIEGNTTGDAFLYQQEDADINFYTNNAFRAKLDNSGNFSIGTASADSKLHVDASHDGPLVTIHQTGGASGNYRGLDVETSSTGTSVQRWFNAGTELMSVGGSGAVSIKGGNLYLTGANDRRIKLSDSGTSGISDANDTVHIRGDNDFLKLNAAASGGIIMEINGGECLSLDSNHWLKLNGGNAQQYGDNQRTYSGSESITWSSSTSANTWTSSYYMAYQKFVEAGLHFGYSGNGAISQHFRISMCNNYTGLSIQTLHSASGGSGSSYHTITFTSGGAYNTRTLKVVNTPAGGQNTANLSGTIYYGLAI